MRANDLLEKDVHVRSRVDLNFEQRQPLDGRVSPLSDRLDRSVRDVSCIESRRIYKIWDRFYHVYKVFQGFKKPNFVRCTSLNERKMSRWVGNGSLKAFFFLKKDRDKKDETSINPVDVLKDKIRYVYLT